MSGIFKLNWRDLVKGLVTAILTALIFATSQNMDLLQTYLPVLKNPFVAAPLSAALAYLLKNLATTEDGKLGGKI